MGIFHHAVLQFLGKLRRRPELATDANQIDRLEKLAVNTWDGSLVALQAPVADDTWAARAALLSADPQSDAIVVDFNRQVRIVGFLPSVVPTRAAVGTEIVPTVKDVLVSISANNERILTPGTGKAQNGQPTQFVTLESISIQAPRYVQRTLTEPNPQLGFTFRWRRGAGVYVDADIRVEILAVLLTPEEIAALRNG